MKSREELTDILKNTLSETLNAKVATINDGTRLMSDLNAESIDFLDIVSELEKEVNYEIDFKALIAGSKSKNDITVGEIVDHLVQNVKE